MKYFKMNVTGFTSDNDFTAPIVIMTDSKNRTAFPIILEGYSRDDFMASFVMSKNIYSEILRKLIKNGDFTLKKILMEEKDDQMETKAFFENKLGEFHIELSSPEGAVLSMESDCPVFVSEKLTRNNKYFRKTAPDLSRKENLLSIFPGNTKKQTFLKRKKDIIQ